MTQLQLSIIIPVKNARSTLLPCLLKMQGLTLSHEIIIVNDHSTDDALGAVSTYAHRIIDLEGKTGPGAARNAGARVAQGAIMLFIDSDVYTSAADIEKSYDEFISGHYACAVARYRHNPELSLLGRYYNHYIMYKYFDKETTNIFFSSFAMIQRACFTPFPERLQTLEDAAIGQQLVQAGHKIHLFASMTVLHQKQVNGVGLTRQFLTRSRDALILSWSLSRQGMAFHDDSVKNPLRLSLLLAPLVVVLSPFPGLAFFLFTAFILVNLPYFLYIARFEGIFGLLTSVPIYFYTILCGDVGIASGVCKVLYHEYLAPIEIRKTPLV